MGDNFKELLRTIAHSLEDRTNINWTIWMHRMRARLNAILMRYNANMILQSGILNTNDDIYWDCY